MNIQKAMENGPVEIVDFPIKHGDFPYSYVSSPEGIHIFYIFLHNIYTNLNLMIMSLNTRECPPKWLLTPCSQSVRDSSSLRLSNAESILLVEYYPGWYCHVLSKSRSMVPIIRTCNRNPTFKPVEGVSSIWSHSPSSRCFEH